MGCGAHDIIYFDLNTHQDVPRPCDTWGRVQSVRGGYGQAKAPAWLSAASLLVCTTQEGRAKPTIPASPASGYLSAPGWASSPQG